MMVVAVVLSIVLFSVAGLHMGMAAALAHEPPSAQKIVATLDGRNSGLPSRSGAWWSGGWVGSRVGRTGRMLDAGGHFCRSRNRRRQLCRFHQAGAKHDLRTQRYVDLLTTLRPVGDRISSVGVGSVSGAGSFRLASRAPSRPL
jgi:hypothetical protein